jgi:hypothetical protein
MYPNSLYPILYPYSENYRISDLILIGDESAHDENNS